MARQQNSQKHFIRPRESIRGQKQLKTGSRSRNTYVTDTYALDTFQDFLIAEHMKPCMHVLEISIS